MTTALNQVYVIHVKRFSDRRQFMERQLAHVGLCAEFILDWDVDQLNDEVIRQYFDNTRLSAAQQSCALKHVLALQKITAIQQGFCLVLEDDAVFSKHFCTGLQQALAESVHFHGDKVIYIGSGGNFFTPKSQRRPGQHLYPGARNRLADSYLLDATTAQKRLQWLLENKISEPIDDQFEIVDQLLGIQTLWLEEPVVEQGSKNGLFASGIENPRPLWWQGFCFLWQKLKRKYIYQLWR